MSALAGRWFCPSGVLVVGALILCDDLGVTLSEGLRRLDRRVLPYRSRRKYDVPRPGWVRNCPFVVVLVTIAAVNAYPAGGWWRLLAVTGLLVDVVSFAAVLRWDSAHKVAHT